MIPEPHALALFAVAAFLLAVVPGPAVVYIVTQSIDGGRLAGLVSALGIGTGGLVHVTFAAVGLSALLLRSAVAFEVVKYAGAVYLIVLGIRRLLTKDVEFGPDVIHERSMWEALPPGRGRERAQSEDGALLLRVPAAVREPGRRARRHPDRPARDSSSSRSRS